MSRKKYKKHTLAPDARYGDTLVTQFINYIMLKGKKSVAETVFYDALDLLEKKIKDQPPLDVFKTAIENVRPKIEVRSKRVGGATYQVPMEIDKKRQMQLAMRWLLAGARNRKGMPMSQRLGLELHDAYNNQGVAFNQREQVHRMAEANKAFAHFGW